MKGRFAALAVVLLFSFPRSYAQNAPLQEKAIVLKRLIELNHYSPRPVDDSFSVSVFRAIMNEADERRLLFTAPEYKQLSTYSLMLDDELQGKTWAFFDLLAATYQKALLRADSIINAVLQKSFDLSTSESITFSSERNFNFAENNTALINRWSRYLKLQMLEQLYEAVHSDSAKTNSFKTIFSKKEPGIREKIKLVERRGIKRILDYPGGYMNFMTEFYLNAIASAFDPHTNYFSPEGKEEFQSALSTEGFSFGIELDENEKGQIVISELVPGGPAWKSGELHKDDELVQLQWEGKDAVDISGATIEEVNQMMEASVHDRLFLKFRKPDGVIKEVTLRKEKMDNEENIVKSFVLKGEKKIGYILLPGFYTGWEKEGGSSCANDVAKEIVKLKRENIDGLVLDLRYNGGGSVGEALEMIGIFIDEGPLAAEKNKAGKLTYYKDPNRGTIYDGPMALMVNGQSASASEMMAASLQDYNRAVIIGSNTYGKATMQELFPLDTVTKTKTQSKDGDFVKITLGKLYRLDGRSAQLNGVAPDIVLPDAFDGIDFREKFSPNVLPSDTAKRNSYYQPLKPLPVNELARRSEERIKGDTDFMNIKKFVAARLKEKQVKERIISLKWEDFDKWMQQQEAELQITEEEDTTATNKFTVDNHQQDKLWLKGNEYAQEINSAWLRNIAEDIYIREAFLVLCDLINLQKTATKN